jgi:RHS repeat-associated protein
MRWVLMLFVILAAVMGGEARAVVVMGRVVMSERVGRAEEKAVEALRVESERAFLGADEATGLVDGGPLVLWFPGGVAVARRFCDADEALEWDGENRLSGMWRGPWKEELAQVPFESLVGEAVEGSTVWRWGYDHRSRRVQRDEPGSGGERLRTVTVFSGGTSAAEYTVTAAAAGSAAGSAWTVPPAATVQHVRGPDLGGGTKGLLYSLRRSLQPNEQSTWLPTFNRYNGRGDVVAQSDIDGTTTWAASYQADGRRTAEAGTNVERHRACTKEEDPTGLLNEGFRYRDMETGTFISRDPLGHVDGPNVYCYVRQNPWTMWDPEGLWGVGDSNGPVLDYLWDLGGGVVDGGIEAVEGMGHAVAHPINTATAVKDGVLAVRDGIGELSSALDAGHVTWGEIGTAYGDGLTEVASDPAKVGKIVGSSAVSLGVGKAAAVGGKLAMAAAVQTNTARTIAVSAVLATAELAPVASGAARGGAIAAQVGTAFAKGAAAGKSVGIPERLGEFYRRLGAQGRADSASEALARLRTTMDDVEDALSGIPKKSPPPAPGMPDGRMYPPLDDFVTHNADGSISAVTKGHRIQFGGDGSTRIINKKTGGVDFEN